MQALPAIRPFSIGGSLLRLRAVGWGLLLSLIHGEAVGTAKPAIVDVVFNGKLLPIVQVAVQGQQLDLVFDTLLPNTAVFVKERGACGAPAWEPCYSSARSPVAVCDESYGHSHHCWPEPEPFKCQKPQTDVNLARVGWVVEPSPVANGVVFNMTSAEALGDVSLNVDIGLDDSPTQLQTISLPSSPVRLISNLQARVWGPGHDLFQGVSGFLGAAGSSASCRNTTPWMELGAALKRQHGMQVSLISLDFAPPPSARFHSPGSSSRVVLDGIPRQSSVFSHLSWSQPKQVGDWLNDARHEFLMYHIKVCNIDLLYNTSSNWLAVLATSSPCLVLPPFLFDRLMSRIPVECPFKLGTPAFGRLCTPLRNAEDQITLPALSFRLNDSQTLDDASEQEVYLPLERLVFKQSQDVNEEPVEQLCVSRSDKDDVNIADMMSSFIGIGSLVAAAMDIAIDLKGNTIGIATRGAFKDHSTNNFCTPSVNCTSPMQTYYPPRNVCLDPECSKYMLMTLDEDTKTCVWAPNVPFLFSTIIITLGLLDVIGHRLYKSAMEKASDLYF